MRGMLFLLLVPLLLPLFIPTAPGAQQQTVLLEGAVRDAATGAPVQNVKVAVYYPSTMGTGFPTIGWPVVAEGNPYRYEIPKPEPGMSIQVWADGYRRQIEPIRGDALERHDFTLTAAFPASGRIVDDATGSPVANFQVMVGRARGPNVEIDPAPNFARTDAQGRFHFDDVGEGPFVLRLMTAIRILSDAQLGDVTAIRNGYARQWIPNDLADALAHAYTGSSGKTMELGDVRVRRSDVFTLSGQLLSEGCGGQPYFRLYQQNGRFWGTLTAGGINCGQAFTIPNLLPGTYYLTGSELQPAPSSLAAARIEISNQNVRVDLRMVPAQQVPNDAFPEDLRRLLSSSGVGSW